MRHLYNALTYLLTPFAFGVVLWRGVANRGYWEGLGERFGFGTRPAGSQSILVHAVSLGEVTAAQPLMLALAAHHPESPRILSTATPTGRARARALFGDTVTVRFLPYDTPGSMRRFFAGANPRLVIVMETELWPNFYRECQRRGIPVILANARVSTRSVSRYRRFGALFRDVFDGDTFVAAQSAADAERFRLLGAAAGRTSVMGNLKFEVNADADGAALGAQLRSRYWPARPVWTAGSTHAGEEDMALDAHAALCTRLPDALLLLVPRHPQRFEAVAGLLEQDGVRFARRSHGCAVAADVPVLLVDTVGELAVLYAASDVAFVGGSLVPVGGHNLLEPAAFGIPVITGPFQANAREVAAILLRDGAAVQVADAEELASQLQRLFADPSLRQQLGLNARRVIAANRGSLARLLEIIESQLAAHPRHGVDLSTNH